MICLLVRCLNGMAKAFVAITIAKSSGSKSFMMTYFTLNISSYYPTFCNPDEITQHMICSAWVKLHEMIIKMASDTYNKRRTWSAVSTHVQQTSRGTLYESSGLPFCHTMSDRAPSNRSAMLTTITVNANFITGIYVSSRMRLQYEH